MAANETTTTRARELGEVVASAIEGRRLLDHPFYRRWEAGGLAEGELAAYAGQYRHFEAALPGWLATVADGLEGAPAELVAQNLADELGHPEPHLALFDRFAVAVGAPPAAAGPAAGELVATYRDLVADGPAGALAGLAAYETQAAAIAASKADGLRRWYGIDDAGAAFWDVHAVMDGEHGAWAVDALAELDADPGVVGDAAARAARAWWSFLDEREAVAEFTAAAT